MASTVEREWITRAGLKAQAVLIIDRHRCGYVELPEGHPLDGAEYGERHPALRLPDDGETIGDRGVLPLMIAALRGDAEDRITSPDVVFDVHGGLTYSRRNDEGRWVFGFDCAHSFDGSLDPISNSFMSGPVRSLEYVVDQCEHLAEQLARYNVITEES